MMLQALLYTVIVLVTGAITILLGYRKNNYHGFMVRQSNFQDNEYDRIFGNS